MKFLTFFICIVLLHVNSSEMLHRTKRSLFSFPTAHDSGQASSYIETESNIEIATPKPEKGRLSGIGRDFVNKAIGGIKDIFEKGVKLLPTGSLDTVSGLISAGGELGKFQNTVLSQAKAIFPGTKWCGDGNISKSDDDLGIFSSTDACCREHDMCLRTINAGDTKHGLENTGLFTRSHCDCDTEFYDCLYNSSKTSIVSTNIGITYFNILGPQCFKEDYPIKSCIETVVTKSNLTKCAVYELDITAIPVYQWFDNKLFTGIPFISG